MAKPKKRKLRRIILGVGHPWFSAKGITYDSVMLTKEHGGTDAVHFKFRNVGNWNKVRLVLEVLK